MSKPSTAWKEQVAVDEDNTPIEDASTLWPEDLSPFVTVGVLTLPMQNPEAAADRELAAAVEVAYFD